MFRINQKVVCVDDSHTCFVTRGQVYTVTDVRAPYLYLAGVAAAFIPANGMLASRFRPVVERKTSISIFHEIARKATKRKPVNAE